MTDDEYEKILNDLETDLVNKQNNWSDIITKLSGKINCELKKTIELSAEATAYRQMLIDDKTQYFFKMYRDMPKLKKLRKTKFEWYSTKYPIKINGTEKGKLIDADCAYHEAKMDYLQNYVNFLSDSIKTVDNVIYSVKNKVDLYNATGLD
jgi:hypothetical protein